MRPLVIDKKARARIKKVIRFAEENKITAQEISSRMESEIPIGDHPDYTCEIPFGFRVCFSIEQHPSGWMRHISVSVAEPGRVPSFDGVNLLLEEFGFRERVGGRLVVYVEGGRAINLLELVDPDDARKQREKPVELWKERPVG